MPWLSADELRRLTGKVRYKAQCRALARRKIPFKPAANGEPLVRSDWDRPLDAREKAAHRHEGQRWDRIGSVRNLPR